MNMHFSDRNSKCRPKIVIGHPFMGHGGSEARVMWLIEALKKDFDLTVVTTGGWNLEALNAFYGTDVAQTNVAVRIAPVPFPFRRFSVAALRGACYQRFARQIAGEYDVRISAYNPTDWGLPAIHFIADFSWCDDIRRELHPPSPGFIYRDSVLRRLYLRLVASYANPSGRDVLGDDRVIANSHWTANLLKDRFRVECAGVIYPSVWAEFPKIAWEAKESSFVMIGRIAPEKQVERAIAILDRVRRRGHTVRLHLCGLMGKDRYAQRIAQLCQDRADWIFMEGRVVGPRKAAILSNCRYGIQTTAAETFGISVAEMIKAGSIVFASRNGGQAEILRHPDLLFETDDEAVEKIDAVLKSPGTQEDLCAYLAQQAQRFQLETAELEALVKQALSGPSAKSTAVNAEL